MRHAVRRHAAAITLALSLIASASTPATACPGTEDCTLDLGSYVLLLPEGAEPDAPVPGLVFLHGWGASPTGFMSGRGAIVEALLARGYALILPEGVPRAGRTQRDWAVEDGGTHPRDDLAFFNAIIADAAARGVDRDRLMLGGFSRGGSMVWRVACRRPEMFRAYAPVAGAFWEPMPTGCAGPVDLFHIHGWDDKVVPLEGRPIGSRLMQGDVYASLAILRKTLGCDLRQPDERSAEGRTWLRSWTRCASGKRIDFELHPGGHIVPDGWLGRVLPWFEARMPGALSGRTDPSGGSKKKTTAE